MFHLALLGFGRYLTICISLCWWHRKCSICDHSQQDPVSTPCGDVFCRQCILIHLEKQGATGKYTCPTCRRRFPTRPALHPYQRQSYQHGTSTSSLYTVKGESNSGYFILYIRVTHSSSLITPVLLHLWGSGRCWGAVFLQQGREKGIVLRGVWCSAYVCMLIICV